MFQTLWLPLGNNALIESMDKYSLRPEADMWLGNVQKRKEKKKMLLIEDTWNKIGYLCGTADSCFSYFESQDKKMLGT